MVARGPTIALVVVLVLAALLLLEGAGRREWRNAYRGGVPTAVTAHLWEQAMFFFFFSDGGWGGWSSWSSCTTSSDKRSCSQRRTRRCYKDGNTYCSGSRSWSRSCTSSPCLGEEWLVGDTDRQNYLQGVTERVCSGRGGLSDQFLRVHFW